MIDTYLIILRVVMFLILMNILLLLVFLKELKLEQ